MDRRTFLKAAGLGSISFVYGCNPSKSKHLFSLDQAPEDMVTGKATWYASTCTECPAGCGLLAKNREGRIIKLEGNPYHPVNRGKLCIRGQSALQGIYDPDRLKLPKLKTTGGFQDISYDRAFEILSRQVKDAAATGNNRIKMLTGITGDPLQKLFTECLTEWHSEAPVIYEPFSHDALKAAYISAFSRNRLPSYRMEKADLIVSFGADFLETWLSPVEYARKFKTMHAINEGKKGLFLHIGPYMSLTAANADRFICVQPGSEAVVALGVLNSLLTSGYYAHLPQDVVESLRSATKPYTLDKVAEFSGITPADLAVLVKTLRRATQPLVLGGGTPTASSYSLELTVVLINLLLDKDLTLFNFQKTHAIEKAATVREAVTCLKGATSATTDLMIFYQTNPVFTMPAEKISGSVFDDDTVFKVVFSNTMDETSEKADLIFPTKLYLEGWDAYESKSGYISTLQPAMGRLTHAPAIGDLFLQLKTRSDHPDYQHYLMDYLYPSVDRNAEEPWLQLIRNGGRFAGTGGDSDGTPTLNTRIVEALRDAIAGIPTAVGQGMRFYAVPSLKFFDGRGANKSWVSEIPDPVTNIAWESMLMMHPDTLQKNGLKQGDILKLESWSQSIQAPIYSYTGVSRDVIVMQTGMGHRQYGRFASGYGANPVELLGADVQSEIIAISYLANLKSVSKVGTVDNLPKTDGSRSQYKRKIAISVKAGHENDPDPAEPGLTMNTFPLTLPIKEGYAHKRDIFPAHEHKDYRWGMIVDLDRCIGCSACVAGCYAENNLGVVGKEQIINGREMSWIRIERYEDQNDKERLIFLPMLCQHCDDAPCESVCPVYAPFHSPEGLNNQIYNRCIGTRFCAQNCPYKVRRFNWLDWEWPKPLNLQLNPNVTVRSKGVMEKCSFCVQRIKTAHNEAKNENRELRDGEVQPACVQTCPTGALVFGNFLDKNSRVYKLAMENRAYQVLGYLNTKPAVIYLKKVLQEV